jgi:hypothetical protein
VSGGDERARGTHHGREGGGAGRDEVRTVCFNGLLGGARRRLATTLSVDARAGWFIAIRWAVTLQASDYVSRSSSRRTSK